MVRAFSYEVEILFKQYILTLILENTYFVSGILIDTPVNILYTVDIDKQLRAERKEKILEMYLACYTQREIAEEVGLQAGMINAEVKVCSDLENLPKSNKLNAEFQDADFDIPLYNVWTFAKKTNDVSHFGNTEVRVLDCSSS